MQWWGDNRLRAMAGALCAVTVVCHGTPAAAAILPNLSSGSSQDAQEAADLADAHSDLSVQRALSAMPVKAAGDKAAASEPRATASQGASPSALQKPATPASASASAPRTPGETLQKTAKDLAVDAKQLLSTEFGSDKTADPNAEGNVRRCCWPARRACARCWPMAAARPSVNAGTVNPAARETPGASSVASTGSQQVLRTVKICK